MRTARRHTDAGLHLNLSAYLHNLMIADLGVTQEYAERLTRHIERTIMGADLITLDNRATLAVMFRPAEEE